MPDLYLSREEAHGRLPAVCMECGKPAKNARWMRLTTATLNPRPHPGGGNVGCLLGVLDLLPWLTGQRYVLRAPLCRWHRWIVPPSFQLVQASADTLRLSGVAEGFVRALQLQRAAGSSRVE